MSSDVIRWEINQWDTTEHWLGWPENTVEQQELSLIAMEVKLVWKTTHKYFYLYLPKLEATKMSFSR